MSNRVIEFRELQSLPTRTLETLAVALARGVDTGKDDRDVLERVIRAIQAKI